MPIPDKKRWTGDETLMKPLPFLLKAKVGRPRRKRIQSKPKKRSIMTKYVSADKQRKSCYSEDGNWLIGRVNSPQSQEEVNVEDSQDKEWVMNDVFVTSDSDVEDDSDSPADGFDIQ
ncbi:hypothetical protein P9112_010557 [Eukaryota sp. TZLM1-RC]